MAQPISPPEDVLTKALVDLKTQNPTMGIAKIHALLPKTYPEWIVSEKRVKKILQHEGLTSSAIPADTALPLYPQSRLVSSLDVSKWTSRVRVKMFDKRKGKGLVASEEIKENDVVWKEDPFIVAAEMDIFDLQSSGQACALCTTPFNDSPLVIPCPSAASSSSYCAARFCNRLCLARSAKVHPLLCTGQNPACAPLIKFAREKQWMALNALAHSMSRLLLANQYDEATLRQDWDVFRGLAALGMEERAKYSFGSEPDRPTWKKAHQLVVQAFKEPKNPTDQKKLTGLLKKSLPAEIERDLFDYEPGFLRNLGKMSLNLEAHGGLYTLHSHLNHSCKPNCSVRHIHKPTALSRITVIAKRAIAPGEELTISYVNPELPYRSRQDELKAWGFGSCKCELCQVEEKTFKLKDVLQQKDSGVDMDDLARELKAGLGVMVHVGMRRRNLFVMDHYVDDRPDSERELWKKVATKLKPDPVTGRVDNNDILTFLREHENDPDLQLLLGNSRKRADERERLVDLDTFDFKSLPVDPGSLWRVRVEYSGLVDPETTYIIEPHELKEFPNAKHSFRVYCDMPSADGHMDEVDTRLVQDYEGMPKSEDVLLFLKKAMAVPISCFKPALPATLMITHKFEPHRRVIAPFLDSILSPSSTPSSSLSENRFSWLLEDTKTAELMSELQYSKASHFFHQHKADALVHKEAGNTAFRKGDGVKAIKEYTQALRRFEDAHCQKVGVEEKAEVMKMMGVVCANRSAAALLPGEGRDSTLAVNDGRKAIVADKFYAKGYARLAKAYQAQGDLAQALDALAEGLRLKDLQNEVGLVDMFVDMQTDGKGLPEDDEEFQKVAKRIMEEDKESAKRVKDIGGLWRERISRVAVL